MIFLILLGADVLNAFFALSQMRRRSRSGCFRQRLAPAAVLIGIILGILLPGCVMDSLSMIPCSPSRSSCRSSRGSTIWGSNPTDKAIWFGILALMVVEIGPITPPVA